MVVHMFRLPFQLRRKQEKVETAFPAFTPILYFRLPSAIKGRKPVKYIKTSDFTAVLVRGVTPVAIKVNRPFDIPPFVFQFYYTVAKMVQNDNYITIFSVINYNKEKSAKVLSALERNKYRFTKTTYQYLFCKDATGLCMYDTVNVLKDTRSLDTLDLDHGYAFMAMRVGNYVYYLLVANYISLETDFIRTIYGVRV